METRCTVCQNHVSEQNVVIQEHNGEEYYFCSDDCRVEFLKDPSKYEDYHPSIEGADDIETLMCARCGSLVSEEDATKQEYKEEEGQYEKYYFCSDECRIEFIKEPHKYTGRSGKHISA
jgi:YHS domain-containing protein